MLTEDAFGPFSHSSLYKSFVLARNKVDGHYVPPTETEPAKPGCLAGLRPYDLRHAFGEAVYKASGDIRATQILMGHSKPDMTHRYTVGAVDARVAVAIGKVTRAGYTR